MRPALNRIMIYAKDMRRTAEFYQRFFGFESSGQVVEGLIELTAPGGGANLLGGRLPSPPACGGRRWRSFPPGTGSVPADSKKDATAGGLVSLR
jgi:catechol 2,3-dioxygenase-like lactoylglutathione lyase family enzyme